VRKPWGGREGEEVGYSTLLGWVAYGHIHFHPPELGRGSEGINGFRNVGKISRRIGLPVKKGVWEITGKRAISLN